MVTDFELTYGVYITGNTGTASTPDELAAWMENVRLMCMRIGSSEGVGSVVGPTGGFLNVSKIPFPADSVKLSGPVTARDEWGRIAARITDKSRQTSAAGNMVIRLDEGGGLWYFTEWAKAPLSKKLVDIAPLLKEAIYPFPHVTGVILSNGWAWQCNNEEPETIGIPGGDIAMRRCLPAMRLKETIFIGRDQSSMGIMRQIANWYAKESSWLDWALFRLGFPEFVELVH